MKRFATVVACLLLTAPAAAQAPAELPVDRRIAVTVDDLPWQHIERVPEGQLAPRWRHLMDTMRGAGVPVTGFVNESRLEDADGSSPDRVDMLIDWLEAGFELGNHTWSHVDLHEVGAERFKTDIERGERVSAPLLASLGERPRWFRHPWLHTGSTEEEAAAVSAFLAQRGYTPAPVTVGMEEPAWAAAYANVLDLHEDGPERVELLQRLHSGYVAWMLHMLDFRGRQSLVLFERAVPQVLRIHANELNAVAYGDLIEGIHRRGYRFVDLERALEDPAYRQPDAYLGADGPGWLERRASGKRVPRAFRAGEPKVPAWVRELAESSP